MSWFSKGGYQPTTEPDLPDPHIERIVYGDGSERFTIKYWNDFYWQHSDSYETLKKARKALEERKQRMIASTVIKREVIE